MNIIVVWVLNKNICHDVLKSKVLQQGNATLIERLPFHQPYLICVVTNTRTPGLSLEESKSLGFFWGTNR
jgi:hypothetical protein